MHSLLIAKATKGNPQMMQKNSIRIIHSFNNKIFSKILPTPEVVTHPPPNGASSPEGVEGKRRGRPEESRKIRAPAGECVVSLKRPLAARSRGVERGGVGGGPEAG
jgi:hypothetical protein